MQVVKLQVPGDIAYRELITRTVAFACKMASQEHTQATNANHHQERFSNELVSAVGEAFNNVAIHGYEGHTAANVLIAISFDKKLVKVELTDEGKTFNPAAVAVPDLGSLPESGMGLYIIRSFVDEIAYCPGPPNVLSLTKHLAATTGS